MAALTQGALIASRYEVLRVLGKGGMGMVYCAHDRMLDEQVAIKVLRTEFANTDEMAQRFRHEIKLARRVTHRNVCRIHEYGEDGNLRYISMEYVVGTDLKQELRERGNLPATEAFDVAIQVADGLAAIHDVGIIHRDLKTPNIMRDERGVIRLMDFGIAKLGSEMGGGGLTGTGQVMGTPEYMSPEQCRGERIDTRSDLYSLGVVTYEIFTGQVPFRGDTPVATIFKHIQDPVPLEGSAVAARLPPSIVPILRRSLAKDRTERYSSAEELAVALREGRAQVRQDAITGAQRVVEAAPFSDRRRATRLEIFVNLMIRRMGTLGTVLQEERTVAENFSRGGARVLTTMAGVTIGEIIGVSEIGGDFETRAEVRGVYAGRDNVRRLNLRFVDREAPERLVRIEEEGP
jgi:serine/threonine protein kinase